MELDPIYVNEHWQEIGMGEGTKGLFDFMVGIQETMDVVRTKLMTLQNTYANVDVKYRHLRLVELKFMDYETYLKTPEWKRRRNRILESVGKRCQRCGAKGVELHVHHLTYERRGEELPEDLIVLCKDCHEKEHGL
jgi:hypothetical protein